MTGPTEPTQEYRPPRNIPGSGDTQPIKTRPHQRRPRRRWIWIAAPALVLIMLAVSILTGYYQGLAEREQASVENAAQVAQDQFDKGLEDLLAGNYALAQQRFEYVLSLDPQFPGASDFLNQALAAMNQPTATASPLASPTPTETPDFSSFEGMFGSAQSAFAREDWDTALEILIRLRGEDPEYRLAEVNQMMDVALRNRGMQKLFAGDLEQGIYDLNLSERFSALDGQAASWRRSAAFYIFADSYFGLDWPLATEYFAQVCEANIWGACTKYGQSAKEYASQLAEEGEDPCLAVYYYEIAFGYVQAGEAGPTATEVFKRCETATAPAPTASTTPTSGTPTPTATFAPGATATFTPSQTSGPSATPTNTSTGSPATSTATSTTPPTDEPSATPMPTATNTPG